MVLQQFHATVSPVADMPIVPWHGAPRWRGPSDLLTFISQQSNGTGIEYFVSVADPQIL